MSHIPGFYPQTQLSFTAETDLVLQGGNHVLRRWILASCSDTVSLFMLRFISSVYMTHTFLFLPRSLLETQNNWLDLDILLAFVSLFHRRIGLQLFPGFHSQGSPCLCWSLPVIT